jgi:hypothetical protein
MKRKLIEAQEAVEAAYTQLRDNPKLVAPQFQPCILSELARINAGLTAAIDACVESEQLNGGLN